MRAQDGGDTALHLACRGGHVAIVESLLSLSGKTTKKRIVDVNIENAAGETPVSIAARAGHAGIVRRILGRVHQSCSSFYQRAEPPLIIG